MNKKIIGAMIIALGTSTLSGCASIQTKTVCKIKKEGTECGIEITTNSVFLNKALRPVSEMLAQIGVFSYQDINTLNPSEFAYSYSGARIADGKVTVNVLSAGSIIDSRGFSVTNNNGVYRFSNPSAVKSYAMGFADVADGVTVTANSVKTSQLSSIKLMQNNTTLASASHMGSNNEYPPTHEN